MEKKEPKKTKYKKCPKCKTDTLLFICSYCGTNVMNTKTKSNATNTDES